MAIIHMFLSTVNSRRSVRTTAASIAGTTKNSIHRLISWWVVFVSVVVLSSSSSFLVSAYTTSEEEELILGAEICDTLTIGAYYFLHVNAWNKHVSGRARNARHGDVLLVGFEDLPGGIDLFLTDKAWSATTQAFVTNDLVGEGTLKLRLHPDGGIPAGIAFGVGANLGVYNYGDEWRDYHVEGTRSSTTETIDNNNSNTNETYYFSLGEDGDQVFLYCLDSNRNARPLTGLSYNGPFWTATKSPTKTAVYQQQQLPYYGTNHSSAPAYLVDDNTNGTLVMPSTSTSAAVFLNWQYTGPMDGLDFYQLQTEIQNTEVNWSGSNPDGTHSSSATAVLSGGTSTVLLLLSMTTTVFLSPLLT